MRVLRHDEERAAVLSAVMENQSCAKHEDEANGPTRHTRSVRAKLKLHSSDNQGEKKKVAYDRTQHATVFPREHGHL